MVITGSCTTIVANYYISQAVLVYRQCHLPLIQGRMARC
uniref:Uncharacterized protein n=1 Tax=Anguilla anguilla TaxID=7936 RepID=A0A0E9R2R2_ANGAN